MYHHDEPRSLITSGGLGTMGFALPAAIGAKMARPDAEVWVVAGDGGFQMTMCRAGDDCCRKRLDIKVAIINNGYLGMVRQWQEFFYERRYAATPLLQPGLRQDRRGVRPGGAGDLQPLRRRAGQCWPRARTSGTSVLEFRV